MDGYREGATIVLDGDARQRFLDASGVGTPGEDGTLHLTWVEAVYLLERGDIDSVEGRPFLDVLATPPDPYAVDRWLVYRDLRERGYYVATTYQPGEAPPPWEPAFHTRPRGDDPRSDAIEHRIAVVPESIGRTAGELTPMTVAVPDDEAAITYIDIEEFTPEGSVTLPAAVRVEGRLIGSRIVIDEPPDALIDSAFIGSLRDEGDRLMMNRLEGRYLVDRSQLTISSPVKAPGELEVDHRRYTVYQHLRDAGCAPRSGFKFGTDFRVYTTFASRDDPGHSDYLVEVTSTDVILTPRVLSRAVRLATGVRKRHVLGIVDEGDPTWLVADRLRP